MMNKKAMLIGSTLKIVLAVAILVLLFIGVGKVYSSVTGDTEIENVQRTADMIEAKINALKLNENTTLTLSGFDSSETWVITGWGKGDINAPDKEECFLSSCICICSNGFQAKECKEKGICKKFDVEHVEVGEKGFTPYVALPKNFLEVEIEKGTSSDGTFIKIK